MITIGSQIEFDGEIYEAPIKAAGILSLIGNDVVKCVANKHGDLIIYFDGNKSIEVFDNYLNLESYSIKIGEKIIFV